jgi:hypothetical protein
MPLCRSSCTLRSAGMPIAGLSGRAIEKKYRVGRQTIVKALSSAWPEPRKQLPPRASELDPFKPTVDFGEVTCPGLSCAEGVHQEAHVC